MVDYWDRLHAALQHAGKTTKDLQEHLRVSYQAMKKVEDGKTKALTAENNARAARFLGINSHWLATGEESMLDNKPPHWGSWGGDTPGAAEPRANFAIQIGTEPWPFTTVTATEYSQLSDFQRGLIEGYTRRLVEELTQGKRNGGAKAA